MAWIDNRVVVITGANSGIGRVVAEVLIKKHNCKVLGVARSEEKFLIFKNALGDYAKMLEYFLFDVGSIKEWKIFGEHLIKNNLAVDVLINCAGVLPKFSKFEDYSESEIETVFATNFFSNLYAIKSLMPVLIKSSMPAIINVSSSAGLCALPGVSIYSASKSAQKNFTESVAAEYKKKIFVSAVYPGFTRTDIFRNQKQVNSKLLKFMSADVNVVGKKIVRGIARKRRRMVIGLDAKLMNFLYKISPKSAANVCGRILKKFKNQLFEDVF